MEANNMSAWLRFATDDRQFNKNGSNRITKQPHSLSSIHQAKQSRLVSRDKQTATNHTLTNNPQSLPLYVRTNVRTYVRLFIHPSIHLNHLCIHTYIPSTPLQIHALSYIRAIHGHFALPTDGYVSAMAHNRKVIECAIS